MKREKYITVITYLFMTIEAMLMGLTILLFTSLSGSIENLMKTAETPDFLQMHAGQFDYEKIKKFAVNHPGVEKWQVCRFLNIDNGMLAVNDKTFSQNTQDNGLCVQSNSFDYLIDTLNEIPSVEGGEVYVPACYKAEYEIETGDVLQIGSKSLTVAGFIRDSQMNSMMASSKRFLVSESDYQLFKEAGTEEYLIEFRLKDGWDVNTFASDYVEAALPANGPTITYSLIKLMNTLSDGMMILVILLVSIVILFISILCIRFILLTTLEKDKPEIGMMKAIGISKKDIRRLYYNKYVILAVSGSVSGLIIAIILSTPLSSQMRELYGSDFSLVKVVAFSVIGVTLVEGILLLLIRRILKKIEKLSAIQILQKRSDKDKGRKQQLMLISVITACCLFLAVVPMNILSTISSEKFVTYMGIGDAELRVDIRQTDNIVEKTDLIESRLQTDSKVNDYVILQTRVTSAKAINRDSQKLLVEWGNHNKFPLKYVNGRAPEAPGEIALSALNASELELTTGDVIKLEINEKLVDYKICGIYSDITNGGKTAKAFGEEMTPADDDVMWSVIYIELTDGVDKGNWLETINEYAEKENISIKATDIPSYVLSTYSQTITQVSNAAKVSVAAGVVILLIVVILFMRMIIQGDRKNIAFKKAIGFTTSDIKKDYLKKSGEFVAIGIGAGILLGIYLGEMACGMILNSFGISKFEMIINYPVVMVEIPMLYIGVAFGAVAATLLEIKSVSAREAL